MTASGNGLDSRDPKNDKKRDLDKKFRVTRESLTGSLGWFGMFMAIAFWRATATGSDFYYFIFGYIGFTSGVGVFLSRSLPKKHRQWGRRVSQILVGLFMLGLLGFLGHENMQVEGFYFYLIAGAFHGALLHYFIAKLLGPVLFGRAWCSWACWTMMVMDLFPWKRPAEGRRPGWGVWRYVHLSLVTGVIFWLVYQVGYGPAEHKASELTWLTVGNIIYYALAIVLAATLKDNRAFCKYVCPIPVFQKVLNRFSPLKQRVDMSKCNECGLCERACLMDIKLLSYSREGRRILSTECILCDSCLHACPTNAIDTDWGLDVGFKELINMRDTKSRSR